MINIFLLLLTKDIIIDKVSAIPEGANDKGNTVNVLFIHSVLIDTIRTAQSRVAIPVEKKVRLGNTIN